jgi:hypothetical protein
MVFERKRPLGEFHARMKQVESDLYRAEYNKLVPSRVPFSRCDFGAKGRKAVQKARAMVRVCLQSTFYLRTLNQPGFEVASSFGAANVNDACGAGLISLFIQLSGGHRAFRDIRSCSTVAAAAV